MSIKDIMLIVHFIGLAMGVGTSIAFIFIGMAASKMEPQDAMKFQGNAFILSRMGHIGITLLVLSGGYMVSEYWDQMGEMPALMAKLTLVLVLIVLIIVVTRTAKKAKATGDPALVRRLKTLGPISMLVGLTIIVLAVASFH